LVFPYTTLFRSTVSQFGAIVNPNQIIKKLTGSSVRYDKNLGEFLSYPGGNSAPQFLTDPGRRYIFPYFLAHTNAAGKNHTLEKEWRPWKWIRADGRRSAWKVRAYPPAGPPGGIFCARRRRGWRRAGVEEETCCSF